MPMFAPPGSSSGTIDTTAPRTWTGVQTFPGYIVVNGIKMRPAVTTSGTNTTAAWQFEVNGAWVEVTSRVNPV